MWWRDEYLTARSITIEDKFRVKAEKSHDPLEMRGHTPKNQILFKKSLPLKHEIATLSKEQSWVIKG